MKLDVSLMISLKRSSDHLVVSYSATELAPMHEVYEYGLRNRCWSGKPYHLVDCNNELPNAQSIGKESMLSGLPIL